MCPGVLGSYLACLLLNRSRRTSKIMWYFKQRRYPCLVSRESLHFDVQLKHYSNEIENKLGTRIGVYHSTHTCVVDLLGKVKSSAK